MEDSDSDSDGEFVRNRKRSSLKQLNSDSPIPPPRLSKSVLTETEKFKKVEASLSESPVIQKSNFIQ